MKLETNIIHKSLGKREVHFKMEYSELGVAQTFLIYLNDTLIETLSIPYYTTKLEEDGTFNFYYKVNTGGVVSEESERVIIVNSVDEDILNNLKKVLPPFIPQNKILNDIMGAVAKQTAEVFRGTLTLKSILLTGKPLIFEAERTGTLFRKEESEATIRARIANWQENLKARGTEKGILADIKVISGVEEPYIEYNDIMETGFICGETYLGNDASYIGIGKLLVTNQEISKENKRLILPIDCSVLKKTMKIITPIGVEKWYEGDTHKIKWEAENITKFKIAYSLNNVGWNFVAETTKKEFDWIVASVTEDTPCRIKISVADSPSFLVISEEFTIKDGQFRTKQTITATQNAESNNSQTTQTIQTITATQNTGLNSSENAIFGQSILIEQNIDGLIAYYPFNGNANDMIGTNHGVVTDAVLTTDRHGNLNKAYQFNGVSSKIVAPNNPLVNLRNYSYSFQLKCDRLDYSEVMMVSHSVTSTMTKTTYIFGKYGDNLWHGSGFGGSQIDTNYILDTNWHTVTVTHNENDDFSKLYVDNIFVGHVSRIMDIYESFPLLTGKFYSDTGTDWAFKGKITNERFYNRELTAADILALANE